MYAANSPRSSSVQYELPIFQSRPAALVGSSDFVADQFAPQRHRSAVVEQDPHLCNCEWASGSMLEHCTGLIQRDAGKPFNKLLYGSVVFKVFK